MSSSCVLSHSLYSHSQITVHTNKTTSPSIITSLRSHMTQKIHHNPNYIINMHFILNGGLEASQYKYQLTWYHTRHLHVFHCKAFIHTVK